MQHTLTLAGYGVRLEPLAAAHLSALKAIASDPELWRFTFSGSPFSDDAQAQHWLDYALHEPSMQTFTIFDASTGAPAGSTRFLEISEEHRKLEIGWTFIARCFWRTHVNTAAKYLLLRHAFEDRHALRVQFKAEAVNVRSHRAILRLGAIHEGTLRNFRIRANGEVRDTAFYSITLAEWPTIEERLLSFLDQSLYNREAG